MRILSNASRRFQVAKNYYILTTGYRDITGTVLAQCWMELEHVQMLQAQAANAFQKCNNQWGFHQRHQGGSISPSNVTFWQLGTKILCIHESFVTQCQSYTTNCYHACNQYFSKVNYSFPILQNLASPKFDVSTLNWKMHYYRSWQRFISKSSSPTPFHDNSFPDMVSWSWKNSWFQECTLGIDSHASCLRPMFFESALIFWFGKDIVGNSNTMAHNWMITVQCDWPMTTRVLGDHQYLLHFGDATH